MSRNPRLTGDELIAALRRAGFIVSRIRGSHHFLSQEDGRCTVVPVHAGEIIGPGLFQKILRDCQLDADDIRELIGKQH